MKILVTGAAGFIGFHLAQNLATKGFQVIGIDNINNYYDINLKLDRLQETGINKNMVDSHKELISSKYPNYSFIKLDLTDYSSLQNLFKQKKFDIVCNLAAQPGVRYSIDNPFAYIQNNIVGFANLLETCRQNNIKHLVYASSSSVYGLNKEIPFSTDHNVDHPISLYAATKKSNELMAHTYSHLFNLPTTGIRFFTVYGPWGRPDMATFKFTKAILNDQEIEVYNYGEMYRDFTFIDDIIEGIYRIISVIPEGDNNWNDKKPIPSRSIAPYRVYNIGNNKPIKLIDFITEIENNLNKKARIKLLPLQPGDLVKTWADCSDLEREFSYKPYTSVKEGIRSYISWFKSYYV